MTDLIGHIVIWGIPASLVLIMVCIFMVGFVIGRADGRFDKRRRYCTRCGQGDMFDAVDHSRKHR